MQSNTVLRLFYLELEDFLFYYLIYLSHFVGHLDLLIAIDLSDPGRKVSQLFPYLRKSPISEFERWCRKRKLVRIQG